MDEIEALGKEYRMHAVQLRMAPTKKDQAESAIAAELIWVLAKLERGAT